MKKVFFVISSFLLVSCFTEPKKEENIFNPETERIQKEVSVENYSTNNTIKDETLLEDNETANIKVFTKNKKDIIIELNTIAENNGKQSVINSLSFLNENKGLMLFGNYEFNVNDVYAVFLNKDYNDGFGEFRISIECVKKPSGSNCMYDTYNANYASAYIFPLQTKESCLKYVELFNMLNR